MMVSALPFPFDKYVVFTPPRLLLVSQRNPSVGMGSPKYIHLLVKGLSTLSLFMASMGTLTTHGLARNPRYSGQLGYCRL